MTSEGWKNVMFEDLVRKRFASQSECAKQKSVGWKSWTASFGVGSSPLNYSRLSGSSAICFSPAAFLSQYLRTQASQLLPAAVSRPVKASAAMSE